MPTSLLLLARPAWAAEPSAEAMTCGEHLGMPWDTVALFVGIFVVSLLVDLWEHRRHGEMTARNAAAWTSVWVALALGFYGWVRFRHGDCFASLFLTGYVLEATLSVDNLLVFIAVFKHFNIRSGVQHRILYYGILGAIFFRAVFVVVGTEILRIFGPWAELVFGGFLVYAAVKMLRGDDAHEAEPDYENMGLVRIFRRVYPVFPRMVGASFFVSRAEAERVVAENPGLSLAPGVTRWMTPAFVCLLVIEGTDILFAFDSVPAIIAVTEEPLLVYSAMIFAILGLRSMYFLLVVLTRYLVHLERAVVFVLFFIAFKMFLNAAEHLLHFKAPFEITPDFSMWFVLGVLAIGVITSLLRPGREPDGSVG